jgi:hypothetical protein
VIRSDHTSLNKNDLRNAFGFFLPKRNQSLAGPGMMADATKKSESAMLAKV